MLNFRVRDLDKMAAQLRAAGIEIKIYPPDPTAGLPACMTLREIRSKCGPSEAQLVLEQSRTGSSKLSFDGATLRSDFPQGHAGGQTGRWDRAGKS